MVIESYHYMGLEVIFSNNFLLVVNDFTFLFLDPLMTKESVQGNALIDVVKDIMY